MNARRVWLLPLVPLYAVGVAAKNWAYEAGLLRVRRLARPVVSVGSLSAGGAGKTPVVLALAKLLAAHGIACAVLTRGYGRGSGVVEEVDAGGDGRRFGDEPLEMARAGLADGGRVFVGAERFEAGQLAEASDDARVHLLDDGFQHRRLARSLDVVLLTGEDWRDWLLPAGNLREGLRSLRRADVIVVREEEHGELVAGLPRFAPLVEVWVIRRTLQIPADRPKRPLAFCGIARPAGFWAMLREAGCELAGTKAFADHHAYSDEDFDWLLTTARHARADGFVTTVKDAVKISASAMSILSQIGTVWVAELKVELLDEEKIIVRLRAVLEGTK